MRAYTVFDDFSAEAREILRAAGVELTVPPRGTPRPDDEQMKRILETYDCAIIGFSQKLKPEQFENIRGRRIIGTASVGVDHIRVPADKERLVTVLNAPTADTSAVAEYTMGCALACCKRLNEAAGAFRQGRSNRTLSAQPTELRGRTFGALGAGNVSKRVLEYASLFGMRLLCWTPHPEKHGALAALGVSFVPMERLAAESDVISLNLPLTDGTRGIVSRRTVETMRDDAIFISVSRAALVDLDALLEKAAAHPNFYVCLDIEAAPEVIEKLPERANVLVTPHIAGATAESRARLYAEVARRVARAAESES